jgi:5-bromo-4-chloroindolyl phosphate hydrolysis protein
MKKDSRLHIAAALALALVVFAVFFIVLRWNIAIAALLSLGCYLGLSLLLAPAARLAGVNIEHIKNGEAIMAALEEGEKDLASIKRIADSSKDPQIQAKALKVFREGEKNIGYIKKNPSKAALARRFFDYYLDKAEELLQKYDALLSAGIETERLRSLRAKTLSALESIFKGMGLQFSRLIASEVIDIEADIKLLESAVRMEDS